MDEPTSALTPAECARLFRIVRQLAADGVGVVYISHRLDEVVALADRVTVLRDGRNVVTALIAEMDRDRMIAAMVGRHTATASRGVDAAGRRAGARGARPDARRPRSAGMAPGARMESTSRCAPARCWE